MSEHISNKEQIQQELMNILRFGGYYGGQDDEAQAKVLIDLFEAGADPNARYSDGNTLLMKAVKNGNLPVVRILLDYGADINAEDRHNGPFLGGTALFMSGFPEITQLLIERGANVNHRSLYGETALRIARNLKLDEVIEVLIQAGAIE
jgi:uncharacterized protein